MAKYSDESFQHEIQEKELTDPNFYTYMAFDASKTPVGFVLLRQTEKVYEFMDDPEAIKLHRTYVDKNSAGQGIGSELMTQCIVKAKELNKKTIWFGV